MSNFKHGYIPEQTQAFKDNKGVFDPSEINELVKDDVWSMGGQLELIETQTASNSSAVDFTTLGEYDIHLLTWSDLQCLNDGQALALRISDNGGTSFQSSNYHFAYEYVRGSSTDLIYTSTSVTFLELQRFNGDQARENTNGHAWIYGLGKAQYAFASSHAAYISEHGENATYFGAGLHRGHNKIDALRVMATGGNITTANGISLYGVRLHHGS